MDWVEVIGYRHEVMHTGVLAHLLRDPARGPGVAAALLDLPDVVCVEEVWTEHPMAGHRPIDLACCLVDGDGIPTMLGVETKVDSAWSRAQLEATVPEDAVGVLLAVGYTALAVTDRELAELGAAPPQWRLVGPQRWGEIVRDHADGDAELERYADRVLQEAGEHTAALEAVVTDRPVTAAEDRDATALGHWAYFHEVVRECEDVGRWDRATLRSGPLLTHWAKFHGGGRADYLEFMGHGDRRLLCVKTSAPPGSGELAASRARLSELLAEYKTSEPRRPGARAKTCTAASWSLTGVSPKAAADRAAELQALLAAQPTLP